MTKEEAIERLQRIDIKHFISARMEQSNYIIDEADKTNEAKETVLSIIEKQDNEISRLENIVKFQSKDIDKAVDYTFELNKEIELEGKTIDLMAEKLAEYEFEEMCAEAEHYHIGCPREDDLDGYMNCIKQYFENKVKGREINENREKDKTSDIL